MFASNLRSKKVLLSDFELWHFVLNFSYLATSPQDDEEFDRALLKAGLRSYTSALQPMPWPFLYRMERSWQHIFDLSRHDDWMASPYEEKSIQAVFWELRLEQVKKVTAFKGR